MPMGTPSEAQPHFGGEANASEYYAPQPLQSDVVGGLRTARPIERGGNRVLARTRSTGKHVNTPSLLLHEALQEAGGPFAPPAVDAVVAQAGEGPTPRAVGVAEAVLPTRWWGGGRVVAAVAFVVAFVTMAPMVHSPGTGPSRVEPVVTERAPPRVFTAAVPLADEVVGAVVAAAFASMPERDDGALRGLWTSGVTGPTAAPTKTHNEPRVDARVRPKVEPPVDETALVGMRRAVLVTVPEGANVKVDGVSIGQSPIALEWREGTTSLVLVTLPGHDAASFELSDRKNAKVLKLELVPNAWNRTF